MSELRLEPFTQEWITIAAKRLGRPVTNSASGCPFCPAPDGASVGERQQSEAPRADYSVAVFPNRYPSFGGVPQALGGPAEGYVQTPAGGRAEIVLYSPRHDTHLALLPERDVRLLIRVWADRTRLLLRDPSVRYVLCFENRGQQVGQTIHHPHGQIYGYPVVPARVARELEQVEAFRRVEGDCLQCEILRRERRAQSRLVDGEDGWQAFVPFAPRFPFEQHLAPLRHVAWLADLTAAEVGGLARLLQRTVGRYDALHQEPMPYMMCIYQGVPQDDSDDLWHLRVSFFPVHRARSRLKYLAGSESGASAFLQDATPEAMAAALRGVAL